MDNITKEGATSMKKNFIILFLLVLIVLSGCSLRESPESSSNSTNTTSAHSEVSISEIKKLISLEPVQYAFDPDSNSSIEISITNNSTSDIMETNLLLSLNTEDTKTSSNPFYLLPSKEDKRIVVKAGEQEIVRFSIPKGYLPKEYYSESRIKDNLPINMSVVIDGYVNSINKEDYFSMSKDIGF